MISGLLSRQCRTLHRFLFPPRCLVCEHFFHPPDFNSTSSPAQAGRDKDVVSPSRQGMLDRLLSNCLCLGCIRLLVSVESPVCTCCGLPFTGRSGEDHLCGGCITEPKYFRIARAALVYEPVLTQVVHNFKYKGKIQLADSLSEILLAAFHEHWTDDSIDMVMPVPLHAARIRKRGYNQAYLLIRKWNLRCKPEPCRRADVPIERRLLVRTAATESQSALGRAERVLNVKNAFNIDRPEKIADRRVLLVDDVYTTGSTVNECARLLVNCGARHVDVLTLARAV